MTATLGAPTLSLGAALFAQAPEQMVMLRGAMRPTPFALPRTALHAGLALDAVARALPFSDRCALPPACRSMAPRRLHGFVAGRLCAEALLRQAGRGGGVGRGEAGQPLWPAGLTGSLAHTEATAYAVVSDEHFDIGIDAEPLPDAAGVAAIRAECCDERERSLLFTDHDAALTAAALFCAKEAYYKAIHRRVLRLVEFTEVEASGFDGRSMRLAPRPGSGLPVPAAMASVVLHAGVVHASVFIAHEP
jgi:enterobactin synthetase component D